MGSLAEVACTTTTTTAVARPHKRSSPLRSSTNNTFSARRLLSFVFVGLIILLSAAQLVVYREVVAAIPAPLSQSSSGCRVHQIASQHLMATSNATHGPITVEELMAMPVFDAVDRWIDGRRELADFHDDDRAMCGLAFLYLNNCQEHTEPLMACAWRMGARNMEELVPPLCQRTNFFKKIYAIVEEADRICGVPPQRATLASLNVGVVDETQMMSPSSLGPELMEALRQDPALFTRVLMSERLSKAEEAMARRAFYVPPSKRPPDAMPPPQNFTVSSPHPRRVLSFPIGFVVGPRPPTMRYKTKRLFDFFPLIPSYFGPDKKRAPASRRIHLIESMNEEWLYATMLQYSMFAFTHKRGGWDCFRNAEIMFYGAVPVASDVLLAPSHTLSAIPRTLLTSLLLHEPLLSAVGYMNPNHTFTAGGSRVAVRKTPFMTPCKHSCELNFLKPGRIHMEAYRAEHEADVAAGSATGLLRRNSPAIIRAYERFARPLWDLYASHYSSASIMSYVLRSIGHEEPNRVLVVGYSDFEGDYLHEGVCSGLSELGIFTDMLVHREPEKYRRLSASAMKNWSTDARTAAMKAGHTNDPRGLGTTHLSRQRLSRWNGWGGYFTARGRWNPFVLHRVGLPHTSSAEQKQTAKRSIEEVRARLLAHVYDLVIYSVVPAHCNSIPCRSLPLATEAIQMLPPQQIIFMDNNDHHGAWHRHFARYYSQYGTVFQREYS